jgi:hypothetical protein
MAELTKQALKVENNTNFPNNNTGYITPALLREFNVDMIDSTVNQAAYNTDSSSWNSSISNINAFTASAQSLTTSSLLITASATTNVITFTKGDGSTFNVTVATGSIPDISNLNQATASLQSFTASANVRLTNLEGTTASLNTSVTNINSFTASAGVSITNLNASSQSQQISIDNLNSKTGSYATTGSNIFTGANTFTSISASSFVSASTFVGDGSKLTGITSSIALPILDEGIPQGNAVSMNFTGSAISATVVGGVAIVSVNGLDSASFNSYTASTDSSISQLNASSASQQVSINALNNATASLFTSASLGLTTASFNNGTRDLTFSKGDGTTFAVNIPDVSGSAGNFVTTSSFNAYTQSNDQRVGSLEANSASVNTSISNLNSATSSLFTSASLGLTTASVNLNVLTLRKGDGTTFNLTVDTGSGQAVPQGTISSSAQITALGFVSSSVTASSLITASISGQLITFTKGDTSTFNLTLPSSSISLVTSSYGAFSDLTTQSGSANVAYPFKFNSTDIIDGVTLSGSTGLQVDSNGVYNIQFSAQAVQGAGAATTNIWFRKNNVDIPNSDTSVTIPSNSRLVAAWNIFSTASAGDNFEIIWQSDSNNTTFSFISGSGTSPNIPSIIATVNRIDIGGNAPTPAGTVSSSAQILAYGIFATTGSNTFTGDQTLIDSAGNFYTISDASGSMLLVAKTFTSASSHITASASNQVNLIFKSNNNTSDLIISGSDNIISNPAAPTAGFKRYVGGTSNIYLNTSSTPQISASMAWSPTFQSNLMINGTGVNSVTWRGPVSSSTSTLASNILAGGSIQIGTSATNHAEKATAGINAAANLLLNGGFSVVANTTTLPAAPGLNSNILFGAQTTLLLYSSSMQYNSNIQNGGITVNNRYSPSAGSVVGALSARTNINTIYGIGHDIQIDGTNTSTSQTKQFIANIIAGYYISSSMGTGDSCNILATGMIGNGLIVTGSSTVANANAGYSPNSTQGSMFVGRFNATDGNKAKTAETVLAVGTGTTTTRKTAFLIDSGSNSYFEGTLTVSGSASFTGSVAGNVVSASISSNTASIDFSLGNYFEVTSSVTPLHLNVTNIKPGTTSTLIVSASASSSILFSPNVAQPSGSEYSGSAGSIDILSLVAFNTSKVNVVSTKALV